MTGRKKPKTKGREETILKKVGSVEIQFGKEMDHGYRCGEGATVIEKDKRQNSTQETTWGKQIPIATGLENKRGWIS